MQVGVVAEPRTRDLRRAVLRPHLGPGDPLPGDDLPFGVHIGAVDDDGTLVGTCFVYPDPCPWQPDAVAWHLRQMATAPDRRGKGVGAAVLQAAVDHVRDQNAALIWCHARETAVSFYAAHGFRGHGEVFTEHGLPHLRMWRDVREPGRASVSSTQ
jgi:predicted GNAT family N-acyltransferase